MIRFAFVAAVFVMCCTGAGGAAGYPGGKLTACPTSEMSIAFDATKQNFSDDDLETLSALVARSRQCAIDRVTLLVLEPELGGESWRAAVREQLVARGIDGSLIQDVAYDGRTYYIAPRADAVLITVFFQ